MFIEKVMICISARNRNWPMKGYDKVFCVFSVNMQEILEIIKRKLTFRRLGITTQREVQVHCKFLPYMDNCYIRILIKLILFSVLVRLHRQIYGPKCVFCRGIFIMNDRIKLNLNS